MMTERERRARVCAMRCCLINTIIEYRQQYAMRTLDARNVIRQ